MTRLRASISQSFPRTDRRSSIGTFVAYVFIGLNRECGEAVSNHLAQDVGIDVLKWVVCGLASWFGNPIAGDMDMLKQEDLDYFRTILSQQVEELLGKASHMVTELIHSGDRLIDPVDIASLETSRSTTLRLRDRESRLIHKIVASLRRIEDGTFGICDICDAEISIARLKARPVTSHCIQCKTKMENHEKLYLISFDTTSRRYIAW